MAATAIAIGANTLVQLPASAMATNSSYFVDCAAGNDANGGTLSAPWRSLTQADKASLGAGQQLMLRRGCTWDGQRLSAKWVGTATAPVLIGAYGTGVDPVIKNGINQDVSVSGAWQVIDHISVSEDPTQFAACGEPLGTHYGFNVQPGAHDNTIQHSTASNNYAGIHLSKGSTASRIVNNLLRGNNMVDAFHADPSVDLGAWGILVDSSHNEIGANQLQGNIAVCSNQGYKLQSNSIELYEASGNSIDHNISIGDRTFSELGGSSAIKSSGNTYAYNVFATAAAGSRFITTRGALDTRYGPVLGTALVHNSTYQTGALSLGVSCGLGCSPAVLSTDSNIFWVDGKILFADAAFPNHNDIYWSTSGAVVVQAPFPLSAHIANPLYTDPATNNLRLRGGTPAFMQGSNRGNYAVDVYNDALPLRPAASDTGAAEFVGP